MNTDDKNIFNRIPALLFGALFSLFLFTQQGLWPNGDPVVMFRVTQSVVDRGSIFPAPDPYVDLLRRSDGRMVSKYGVAQSLVEAPFYAIGKALTTASLPADMRDRMLFFFAGTASPFVSALACVILFLLCCDMGLSRRNACAAALLYGLGSMAWPASKQIFSEPLQSLFILIAMWGIARSRKGCAKAAIAGGLAAGLLVATKWLFIAVVPFLLICGLGKQPEQESSTGCAGRQSATTWAALFTAFAAGLSVALWYNHARFGSFLSAGYNTGRDAEYGFSSPLWVGLYGLLLSPGKSVFLYNPVLLLAFYGAGKLWRQNKPYLIAASTSTLFLVILYAKWWAWHGDWSWGPRFLMPCVAIWIPAAGAALSGFSKMHLGAKSAIIALLAFSLYTSVLGVSVNMYEYIHLTRHQVPFNPMYMPGRPGLRDDMAAQHYIPEFSPLVGHQWMLEGTIAAALKGRTEATRRMTSEFPWKMSLPYAPPNNVERAIGFDAWWRHLPESVSETRRWARPLAVCEAVCAAIFFSLLLVLLKRKREPLQP